MKWDLGIWNWIMRQWNDSGPRERILGDQDYWPNWGLPMTQPTRPASDSSDRQLILSLRDVDKKLQHLVSFPPMLPFWGRERINVHQIKTEAVVRQLQGKGSFWCQSRSQLLFRYSTRWGRLMRRQEWESVRGTMEEKWAKENRVEMKGQGGLLLSRHGSHETVEVCSFTALGTWDNDAEHALSMLCGEILPGPFFSPGGGWKCRALLDL